MRREGRWNSGEHQRAPLGREGAVEVSLGRHAEFGIRANPNFPLLAIAQSAPGTGTGQVRRRYRPIQTQRLLEEFKTASGAHGLSIENRPCTKFDTTSPTFGLLKKATVLDSN